MPGFDGAYSGRYFRQITPSDSAPVEPRFDGLWIGVAGDVVCVGHDGVEATFKCQAGSVLPISPLFVKATGTTSTNIVGIRP